MKLLQTLINVRYEDAPWPLWRLDLSLRYILRSLFQERSPRSEEDRLHYERSKNYLRNAAWQGSPSKKGRRLRLKACGDMMWIRSGFEDFLSPEVDQVLHEADLKYVNLETPIYPKAKVPRWVYDTLVYNAPVSFIDCFFGRSEARHLVSICNNHVADQGTAGVDSTKKLIEEKEGALCLGGNNPIDSYRIQEVNGIKLFYIGSTYHVNQFKRKGGECWPRGVPVIGFGDRQEVNWDLLRKLVEKGRAAGADLVVFCPHWGYEYEHWPGKVQRSHAHRLIELGVDIVLGTSPHVLQPVEVVSVNDWDPSCPVQISRPGPRRPGIIAYSLGNFATIMPTTPCKTAGILDFELCLEEEGGLSLEGLAFIPTYTKRGKVHLARTPDKQWTHAREIMGDLVTSNTERIR